ncbi:MAG: hypothetical protein WCA00_19980 [Candidatus Acidiferrales bacterium]
MKLQEIWRWLFRGKYSAILEAEVARLRAENRALLNSILGIAGVPPITVGAPGAAPVPDARAAAAETGTAQQGVTPGSTVSRVGPKNAANVAAPTRRRSWHQVYRMLEIDSARKKEAV